jgi:protein tyrosine/serine phosphatase
MKHKSLFVFPISVLMLLGCSSEAVKPSEVKFTPCSFDQDIELHSETQLNAFINNFDVVYDDVSYDYLKPYDSLLLKEDLTKPNKVHLSLEVEVDKGSISEYKVYLSENEDMSNKISFTTSTTSLDITNLKIDTNYYWQIEAYDFKSEIATFTTSDTMIRGIDIDGVNNVRDIGGYGLIKQGMIYRGGAFEKYNKTKKAVEIKITDKGINTIKNELGIKTEIDLRRNDPSEHENCDLTKSTVDGLNYVALPMQYGGENILTWDDEYHNPQKIKSFFILLADKTAYPIYMHCSQGKDRTGCLAYLVEALMGVESTSLYMDYLYSSLSSYENRVNRRGIDEKYGYTLKKYKTDEMSLSEKVYSYLNEVIGLSSETLDSVKDNLSI